VGGRKSLSLSLSREPSRPVPTDRSGANDRPTLLSLSLSLGPSKSSRPPPIDRRPTTDQPSSSSLSLSDPANLADPRPQLSLSLSDPANPGARRSISANHAQAGEKNQPEKRRAT